MREHVVYVKRLRRLYPRGQADIKQVAGLTWQRRHSERRCIEVSETLVLVRWGQGSPADLAIQSIF